MSSPTRGRSMRPNDDEKRPVAAPPPTEPAAQGEPAAPFASFGPGAGSMGEMAEENRSQSLGILAIVGGLGFAVVAAGTMVLLVVILWFLYWHATADLALTDKKPTKDQHVRDTGYATPSLPEPGSSSGGGRRGAGPATSDPNYRDPSLGPPPGPASIIVPKNMMFLSIELNCPGGYRSRGDFRKDAKGTKKATVPNVPSDERCTVTFQGSEPAKTWISGNQTMTCTFGPIVCHQVF